MPLSLLQGDAWQGSRKLLRSEYERTTVIGLASAGRDDRKSFSADTGMGEVLVIARRRRLGSPRYAETVDVPVTFVALRKRPTSGAEAAAVATAIRDAEKRARARVMLGNDVWGRACPGNLG